mmetsp:Transcript_11940/g.28958  ORF Transcript_11940/g.28958 Transcript_11940/m.28958 type:complete len:215 (+) Transcript_11940:716-1360(+)
MALSQSWCESKTRWSTRRMTPCSLFRSPSLKPWDQPSTGGRPPSSLSRACRATCTAPTSLPSGAPPCSSARTPNCLATCKSRSGRRWRGYGGGRSAARSCGGSGPSARRSAGEDIWRGSTTAVRGRYAAAKGRGSLAATKRATQAPSRTAPGGATAPPLGIARDVVRAARRSAVTAAVRIPLRRRMPRAGAASPPALFLKTRGYATPPRMRRRS